MYSMYFHKALHTGFIQRVPELFKPCGPLEPRTARATLLSQIENLSFMK